MLLFSSLAIFSVHIIFLFCEVNEIYPKFRQELLSTKLIVMEFYQHYDLYIGLTEDKAPIHSQNNLMNEFA